MATTDTPEAEYPVVTRPDTYGDGSWCVVADHPDLPGCFAYGKDETEAKALLKEARAAYVEHLRRNSLPVPQPSRPAT